MLICFPYNQNQLFTRLGPPALFLIFVLFYVLFVLCRSVYCLLYMYTVLLPPGGYPAAVNKYINMTFADC
jgi:hypothetical protein